MKPENLNFLEKDKNKIVDHSNDKEYLLKTPKTGTRINQVMKDLIIKTLEITDVNQIQAAKILGITRSKLHYRMEQLNIEVKKLIQ